MKKIISGIQQIGIGIPDVHAATDWYKTHFGMDIKVFEDEATAELMLPYTGGKPHDRTAILTLNMLGGGGFEIWQYTSRNPVPLGFDLQIGDLGINCAKIKSIDVEASFHEMSASEVNVLSGLEKTPAGEHTFFVQDPWENIFQIIESNGFFDKKSRALTGGASGALIGSSDIDAALPLYQEVLGYDDIVYDEEGTFKDLWGLPGHDQHFRRVLLRHSKSRTGGFSALFGPTEIELIQSLKRTPKKLFEGRYWGDLGFIHLCFDIQGMDALKEECEQAGYPFTVDSANSFDMGEAAGRFTYIEDPDGTLIEFVETHKVPIMKKIGWFIDMTRRDPEKSLPNWMIKALRFSRMK